MATTTVNGIVALHCIITDACTLHHCSAAGAFEEAVSRLRKEFDHCVDGWGNTKDVDYHLVLTVDSPRHKAARKKE